MTPPAASNDPSARADDGPLYLGIDVGGTKILGCLVTAEGERLARYKQKTPRQTTPEAVTEAISNACETLLADAHSKGQTVRGIGLAIPGIVDPDSGRVIYTPNTVLSGVELGSSLHERLGTPVFVGNDVSLGTLGEKWLGAAADADSAVGIFVGTGIGGGIVRHGRLVRGAREAGGEIGHIVLNHKGPPCAHGDYASFESLASRTAIEDRIRRAVAKGKTTVLTELVGQDLSVIKSGALKKALDQNDKVVTKAIKKACKMIGYACVTVRHLLDPEVIVIGGGVVEACADYMLPRIRKVADANTVPGARDGGRIVESKLGDYAVVLGAVAWARAQLGDDAPVPVTSTA